MKKCFLAVCLALCACAARGQAQVVTPVTAIDSSHYNDNRKAVRLMDGSGLNEVSQMHDSDVADSKMWMGNGNSSESVRFNFGSVQYIGEMKLWNFNWTGYTNRGVRVYDVLVSTQAQDPGDPITNPAQWTVVRQGLTLPMAPGLPTYTGEAPVVIGENAHWLAIRATSNHGGDRWFGLSEVRFYVTQTLAVPAASVPEGAAGTTNSMTFTLSASVPLASPVTVGYATSNMTAVAGVDYVATNGVLAMPAGATSATITVLVIGNDLVELDKTFALRLELLSGNASPPAVAYGTILNDDVPGQVALLSPIGVTATSQYNGDRAAIWLYNGAGMDEAAQTHDADAADRKMWQSGNNNVTGQSVRFNFGSVRRIEQIKLWNFNWTNYTDRGVNGYDVLVSTNSADPGTDFDNPARWILARSGLILPQAPGLSSYAGAAPVVIGTSAQWLAIRINSRHGSNQGAGLSEVRFYTSPPPGTLPPILAAASSTYSFEDSARRAVYLIDGSGIDEAAQTHDSDAANDKMWMSSTASDQSVRFDLGANLHVGTMKIWNFNWTNYTDRGVNGYDVLVSTNSADPGTDFNNAARWTAVHSNLTLLRAPGLPTYTGEAPVTINEDARWVAIRINSTQGNNSYVGLSEVRFFDGNQVMLPVAQAIATSVSWDNAEANRGSTHLIDGSGFNEAAQTHANLTPNGTMWFSGSTGPHSVRFAFDDKYFIKTMKIWNLNWSDSNSPIDYAGYGVREYDVLVSTLLTDPGTDFDDPARWTAVHSNLTLPKGPGTSTYTGAAPITIKEDARWVAIRVRSNYGAGPRVGLSEVRFTPGQRPKGTVLIVR